MKLLRFIPCVLVAAMLIAVASCKSSTQSKTTSDDQAQAAKPQPPESPAQPAATTDNRDGFQKYQQLLASLRSSGNANVARQITGIVTTMQEERKVADLALSVEVLQNLRTGKTNEAYNLLETRLDKAVAGYDVYQHTPAMDKAVLSAREYRARFPHRTSNRSSDARVARALNSVAK